MSIHKKREAFGRAVARIPLESVEPVEFPPAEVKIGSITVERMEFQGGLIELIETLGAGGVLTPAPIVQSDSLFILNGRTKTFWVRLWHTDPSRTCIARIHLVNCLPRGSNVQIRLGV